MRQRLEDIQTAAEELHPTTQDLLAQRAALELDLARELEVHGSNHPRVAETAYNLALILQRLESHDEAQNLLEFVINQAAEGGDLADPLRLAATYNLGLLSLSQGRTADSISFFSAVLEQETEEPVTAAASAYNLGVAFSKLGDREQAALYFRRALDLALNRLGPENPTTRTYEAAVASTSG